MKYFKLFRIDHWVKNLYIFAPIFFGGQVFLWYKLQLSGLVFIFFSIMSSSVYIFNDWRDIESDKLHPVKKSRPLANGSIKPSTAIMISFVLAFLSLSFAFIINYQLGIIIGLYALLNIGYSLYFKRLAIIDVTLI